MKKYFLLTLLLHMYGVNADCSAILPKSAPDGRFVVLPDGMVKDVTHKLLWMQCSVGQIWNGSSCVGEVSRLPWASAVKTAATLHYGNITEWRLPNKNELNTIVESACSQPAINSTIFPQTVNRAYWTSSPYDSEVKYLWVVVFSNGSILPLAGSSTAAIRLVKDINE